MKYKIIICIMVLFIFNGWHTTFAKKVMILPGLADPFILAVKDGKVYISDSKKIKVFIYSLSNSMLLKEFLKRGVGPQECPSMPRLQLTQDSLSIYSYPGKVLLFSKDGVYKDEFRLSINGLCNIFPVGKNYAIRKKSYSLATSISSYEFSIYTYENKKAKFKKVLYGFSMPPERRENNKTINPIIYDYTDYVVYDNKVFMADSRLGLYVLIFDNNGNHIGKINIPYEKLKISEKYKKDFFDMGKRIDPMGFEYVQSMYTIRFPEYFPHFFRIAVDRGKIYFLTYRFKADQREVVVADFKGNVLKKAYVPLTKMGIDDVFSIDNDKFYYILENEDTEEYELHVADIK